MRNGSTDSYNYSDYNNSLFKTPTKADSMNDKHEQGASRIHPLSRSFIFQQNPERKFIATSCSSKAPSVISDVSEHANRDGYFTDILNYCIENKLPLSFYIDFNLNEYALYRINLLPLIQPKASKVFANIEQCIKHPTEYVLDNYINTSTCILCKNNGAPRFVKRISAGFVAFCIKHHARLKDIIQSSSVDKCLFSNTPSHGDLEIEFDNGESKWLSIHCVPYHSENNSREILVTILRSEESSQHQELIETIRGITNREQEVLSLAATGCTNRYIAHKLIISEGTVKKTLYNAYKKLGITSRMELVKLIQP